MGIEGPRSDWRPTQAPTCTSSDSLEGEYDVRGADRRWTLVFGATGTVALATTVLGNTADDKQFEALIASGVLLAVAGVFHFTRLRADDRVRRCDRAVQLHRQCMKHEATCDAEQSLAHSVGKEKLIPPMCGEPIAAWRAQTDPLSKTKAYERMSAVCKAAITRKQAPPPR